MSEDTSTAEPVQSGEGLVKVLYDLRCWGASFDFLVYLCFADGYRRLLHPSSTGIQLTIVTGEYLRNHESDFRGVQFGATYQDVDDLNTQRLHKALLPITSLLPTVKSVNVIDLRYGQQTGNAFFCPANYDPNHPDLWLMYLMHPKPRYLFMAAATTDVRILENSSSAIKDAGAYAQRLVGSESPVVITLRNNKFSNDAIRNNTQRYLEIAQRLSENFPVIVVPDTADIACGITTSLPVAYEAAIDIRLRSALYEIAKANFCGSCGPIMLMSMNKKAVYYYADIESENFPRRLMDVEWEEARKLLIRIGADPDGVFQERLRLLRHSANFYSSECRHQVCDFDRLTLVKAEGFLSSLT